MKLVYRLSNPLICVSERICERLAGFLSNLCSLVWDGGRQWFAQPRSYIERVSRGVIFDSGFQGRNLLSANDLSMPASLLHVDDQHRRQNRDAGLVKQTDHMRMVNLSDGSAASTIVRVDDLLQELELNSPKDLSPPRMRLRDKAIALVRDEALLEATYSFNHHRLEWIAGGKRLYVGGETLSAPVRLPKRGELTALGCGACTLGPRLETQVRELLAGKRAAQALALDYLGNELLLALERRMRGDMLASVRRQGLILGQELQFGQTELDLPTQAVVMRLAGATEIGITLHRGNLLLPQKANAVVFAVGRNLPKLSRSF